jgi:peptide/nickel transport system ATP-binding protein
MYSGRIIEQASVSTFFHQPIHPYSNLLLRAATAARDRGQAETRATTAPLPPAVHGCAYAGRCAVVQPACRETAPALEVQDADHLVRCLRRQELARGEVAA